MSIFFTETESLSSVITFLLYAFLNAFKSFSIFSGMSNMSFPAKNALREIFLYFLNSDTPFISSASVITNPLKPNFFISKLSTIFFDNEEGIPSSKAG